MDYDYDRYGNRLHQTPSNGGNPLSLVYLNNQIVATGITYDASGNMTNDGAHQYAYDAENRLISVDGGVTASYVYDASGRRVRATVGSVSTDFIYDVGGQAVGIMSTNGTLIRQEIGGLATYSDAAYFHHRDWLGNLRAVTDQTGAIRQTCTNLPYGDSLTCTPASITPTYFAGYMRDTETTLDFVNARYFTSQYGRFMSVDPLGGSAADPQSLNPYAYVRNNPLSATDPSGMSPDCPGDWCVLGPNFVGMNWLSNATPQYGPSGGFSGWSFGAFTFTGATFGSIGDGHLGGIPGFSGVGLCGVIAGCGANFGDNGPARPSAGQLNAEVAFSAPGAGGGEHSRDPYLFKALTAEQSNCLNKERGQLGIPFEWILPFDDFMPPSVRNFILDSPVKLINGLSLYAFTDERQRGAAIEWTASPLAKYLAYRLFMKYGGPTVVRVTELGGRALARGVVPATAIATYIDATVRRDCGVPLIPRLK